MKRIILAAAALSAALAVPASAQYRPGLNSYDYQGPNVQVVPVVPRDSVRPVQRYERYDRYEDDDFDDRRYERRRTIERDYDRPRRYGRRGGGVCVTSRGSCPTFQPLPANAPCRCDIPGFGEKRGAVAY